MLVSIIPTKFEGGNIVTYKYFYVTFRLIRGYIFVS